MKKLTLLLSLSLLFSSTAFAEWTIIDDDAGGNEYYVDFDRIRKIDGFIYYWKLQNYIEPTEQGFLSAEMYMKGDCKLVREQDLSIIFYKQAMGRGEGAPYNPPRKWRYHKPDTIAEYILNTVCK